MEIASLSAEYLLNRVAQSFTDPPKFQTNLSVGEFAGDPSRPPAGSAQPPTGTDGEQVATNATIGLVLRAAVRWDLAVAEHALSEQEAGDLWRNAGGSARSRDRTPLS